MAALLEYFDLVLAKPMLAKTHLQKGFPETLGNSPSAYSCKYAENLLFLHLFLGSTITGSAIAAFCAELVT